MSKLLDNMVIIKGEESQVDEFLDYCKIHCGINKDGELLDSKNFTLNTLVPIPRVYSNDFTISERKRLWGTTSDIFNVTIIRSNRNEVNLWFLTKLLPPKQWTKAIAKMFPKLRMFHGYIDEDISFSGILKLEAGKELRDVESFNKVNCNKVIEVFFDGILKSHQITGIMTDLLNEV